ncbi:hypothetical protein FIE12Z_11350 [Fusarium flagelliforme]|uniref:DUF7908 domain-containing protein n=1 Tax=Fusarium flagelliforme TaxID=2675880 RepID=A0A395M949_9HYPO|nr:hypothetical protein FIE12Z_11350 [Fusarium flagelliforme]
MALRRLTLSLLGTVVATANGFQDLEPFPKTYCITYLSTYLVPLSAVNTGPVATKSSSSPFSEFEDLPETLDASLSLSTQLFISESGSPSFTTPVEEETITSTILSIVPTAPFTSTTGISGIPPGGRAVIFRVIVDDQEDTRGVQKRDVGGFVGTQTDDCNAADTFRLVEGQLIDDDVPIYYAGEDFKSLRGQPGAIPRGAITKSFASQGGTLGFTNPNLPNGEANFCQDPADGQVYITFTSAPANCVPVRLSVVDAQLCDEEETVESTTLQEQSFPISTEGSIPSTASSGIPQNPETTSGSNGLPPIAPTTRLQTPSDFIPPPIVPTSRLQTSSFRFSNTSTFSNPPVVSSEQVEPTFISLETSSTIEPVLPDPSKSEVLSFSSEATAQPAGTTIVTSFPTDILSTETLSIDIPIESDDTTIPETATSSDMEIDSTTTNEATSTTTANTSTEASTESDTPATTEEPTTTDASETTTEAETTTTEAAATCESVLANPTPVSQANIDEDGADVLATEFQLGLFEDIFETIVISPFGMLTFTNGQGVGLSGNQDIPTSQVDPAAVFPYWDSVEPRNDKYDITYENTNDPNFGRVLIVNYCVFSTAASTKPNHFTITFYEDYLGFIRVNYYQTENMGGSASIGVQNTLVSKFLKKSFNEAIIQDRTILNFDTRAGIEFISTGSF